MLHCQIRTPSYRPAIFHPQKSHLPTAAIPPRTDQAPTFRLNLSLRLLSKVYINPTSDPSPLQLNTSFIVPYLRLLSDCYWDPPQEVLASVNTNKLKRSQGQNTNDNSVTHQRHRKNRQYNHHQSTNPAIQSKLTLPHRRHHPPVNEAFVLISFIKPLKQF